jgi:hypothetical protein
VEDVKIGSTDFSQWDVEIDLGRQCKANHNLEVKLQMMRIGLCRGGSSGSLNFRTRL